MLHYNVVVHVFSDIFSVERWRNIFTSSPNEDPRILALKNDIPEYCLKSKAEITCKKFNYTFNVSASGVLLSHLPKPDTESRVAAN